MSVPTVRSWLVDAAQRIDAPDGYLLRTNYSVSGRELQGQGYIRYETAKEIFSEYYKKNKRIWTFSLS